MDPYRYRTEMPKAVDRLTLTEAVLDAREAILTAPHQPRQVTVLRDGLPVVSLVREIGLHPSSEPLTEQEYEQLLLCQRRSIDLKVREED